MGDVHALTVPGIEDLDEIGRGGSGVVYRGRQAAFDRDVAVKVLQRAGDSLERARFEREMRAVGRLSGHPGILTVFDVGFLDNGFPYLVMQYVPETLQGMLDRASSIPWQMAASLGAEVARTLDHIHSNGVLHGDVKPANIFVTEDGRALLGDFGLAVLLQESSSQPDGLAMTPAFAAPEVIGGAVADPRTDIYGLGATLYAAVAGRAPFEGRADEPIATLLGRILHADPPALDDHLGPPVFREVIRRAIASSPDDRFSTAGELERALLRVLGNEGDLVSAADAAGAVRHPVELLPLRAGFRYVQQPQSSDEVLPWLGHDDLVQRLADRLLHADGGAYLITGFRGVGKSTVVARALRAAELDRLGADLVPLHLNVARPLAAPHLLLVDAVRQLYETFFETDQLHSLGDVTRRTLELAYVRTAALLTERSGRSNEAGGSLSLAGASLSGKRETSQEVERAFQTYTDADIEHDFLRIARLLQSEAGRRRASRIPVRRTLARRRQLVVVLDEIDKLTATPEGRTFLEAVLRNLKNVLSARNVHFLFVAGPDLHDEFARQGQRGNSLFESIFSVHLYVPVLWQAASVLVPELVQPDAGEQAPAAVAGALRFRSRGVTRRLLQQLNDLVVWSGGAPALRIDRRQLQLLELHAEVDDAVLGAVAIVSDEIPGSMEDDRVRLATYVVVDWILSGAQAQLSAGEVRRAMGVVQGEDATDIEIADEALHLSGDHVESILDFLAGQRILQRAPTIRPDVPQTYTLDPALRRRLVELNHIPRRGTPPPPSSSPPPPPDRSTGNRITPDPSDPDPRWTASGTFAPGVKGAPEVPSPWVAGVRRPDELGGGRYSLQEVLGVGGFGTTYRARDRRSDRDVTARVLDAPTLVANEAARDRFLREARLVQRLAHPNIFRVLDILQEPDGRVALITDPVFGRALAELVREDRIAVPEALDIVGRLLDAVGYLHEEGVTRIDLTPGSVVVTSDGTPVITDLGSARRYEGSATVITQEGALVGSIVYAAPEVLEGDQATQQSDIYSVGLLLFELLGGRFPWDDTSEPLKIIAWKRQPLHLDIPGVSAELLAVLARATDFNPQRRYPSAREMSKALSGVSS